MTPEARAREQIDTMLKACGWEVQDYKQFNPSASRGIALVAHTTWYETLFSTKDDTDADEIVRVCHGILNSHNKNRELSFAANRSQEVVWLR